ncbi:hypothetical protein PT974_09644 [Cladobotryum mycophilum]|uniref:Uncharacterized protein n=1 Tax=Cladobotryum mycophilum TaxID=491253 RepID=A0ABR0SGQ6_9HYPO
MLSREFSKSPSGTVELVPPSLTKDHSRCPLSANFKQFTTLPRLIGFQIGPATKSPVQFRPTRRKTEDGRRELASELTEFSHFGDSSTKRGNSSSEGKRGEVDEYFSSTGFKPPSGELRSKVDAWS